MKQTAVNFLIEQMFVKSGIEVTKENNHDLFDLFNQALEMERQQIIDAYVNGNHSEMRGGKVIQTISEQYYTQTFTEPKND